MRQDFYTVLGLMPTASAEDIRQAFRQLARQYHPDANPGDPAAAEHFKVINEAYRVLGTPQLRAAYDQALRVLRPTGAPTPSQAHIPTPPRPQSPSSPARATPSAKPALSISVLPAQAAIVPPRELTRFYLLAELGTTGESAVIDPLPLDLALTIDRSSSMKGPKLFETKHAVLASLDQLRMDDLITLVFFDDRAEVLADGETVRGRAGIENGLERLAPRGGTEIASGLSTTLERLAARQTRSRVASLVLLTDGRTYGDEQACLELAARARDMGVSITALGMGLDWNRELLDRLAAISGGSSHFVEHPSELRNIFEEVVLRLRATLASGMRLKLEPAPGVRIARATRVAPDIAEAYGAPDPRPVTEASGPITIDLGALVGRPDIESAAVLWEVLLDPAQLQMRNNAYDLGRLSASYWAPRQGGGQTEHLEAEITVPVNLSGQHAPMSTDVRLALELITAYRLQTQADRLKASGQAAEAARRMSTAALRLQAAGSGQLAREAHRAAQALMGAGDQGVTETLRVKYGTKSLFHRLRSKLHIG
jgi:Ca-activated chloride channel family protein